LACLEGKKNSGSSNGTGIRRFKRFKSLTHILAHIKRLEIKIQYALVQCLLETDIMRVSGM